MSKGILVSQNPLAMLATMMTAIPMIYSSFGPLPHLSISANPVRIGFLLTRDRPIVQRQQGTSPPTTYLISSSP